MVGFCSDYEDKYGEDTLTFDQYQKLCTGLFRQRYNRDYTYYLAESKGASPEERDYPIERGYFNDQQLKDICDENSNFKFSKIPNIDQKAEYGKIYTDLESNDNSLENLSEFLNSDKLSIDTNSDDNNKRIAYNVKLTGEEKSYKIRVYNNERDNTIKINNVSEASNDFYNFLKYRNLIYEDQSDNKLSMDFNGWIYVDNQVGIDKLTLKFPNSKVVSHGGIILSQGDIFIDSDIISQGKHHLTIIAENGNIIISESVNEINASLVAGGGQVKLDGNGLTTDKPVKVVGNIVMKSIEIDSSKKKCKGLDRGMTLEYNTDLSVLPFTKKNNITNVDSSEYPMLMFDLKENPTLID